MIKWFNERWLKDNWLSTNGTIKCGILKYDKVEHFILAFVITLLLHWRIALGLSIGKEIWDEFVPYQKYGWIGGEGFSFKDLIADFLGIIMGLIIRGLL